MIERVVGAALVTVFLASSGRKSNTREYVLKYVGWWVSLKYEGSIGQHMLLRHGYSRRSYARP